MNEENRTLFGHMPDGTAVGEIVLTDGALSCGVITYGGALRFLTVPGQTGGPVDVVLGYDTVAEYEANGGYFGALVGRFANRIAKGRFTLDGREYTLACNDGPNHLHGGTVGWSHRVWGVEEADDQKAVLTLDSPDGEEGYPGHLQVRVTYALQDAALSIHYQAAADRAVVAAALEEGKSLEEASASYVSQEAFETWYAAFCEALSSAVGE